jgi:Sec-independent protein secretion pathway component TatC
MAWSMLLGGDPDASLALVVGSSALAGAGTVFAYFLYRPLFRASAIPSPAPV